ncbi:MAG: hypothetical protein AAGI22_18365 [Planctomycetota bacterium]
MNTRTDPKPLSDSDVLQLQSDAEMLARMEWMYRAAQAEMLYQLEGRSDEEQERIRHMIRRAKDDVRVVWGDCFKNAGAGESSLLMFLKRRGPHDTVTLWSRMDQAMNRLASRVERLRRRGK